MAPASPVAREEPPVSEEEPPMSPDAPASPVAPHAPTATVEEDDDGEESEEEEEEVAARRGKQKQPRKQRTAWSLPDTTEQDLVEWLKDNNYLWLRSTRDYHRRKQAWELKAEEIGVSLVHLQKWWKNLKDWYMRLLRKTSGQSAKILTARDKWILSNLAFYKGK